MNEPLSEIIKRAGGPAAVGRAFNITSQAVSQWERCPAERVPGLAKLAGATLHEIRPDIYDAPAEREDA